METVHFNVPIFHCGDDARIIVMVIFDHTPSTNMVTCDDFWLPCRYGSFPVSFLIRSQDCLFYIETWAVNQPFLSLAHTGDVPVVDFAFTATDHLVDPHCSLHHIQWGNLQCVKRKKTNDKDVS
ncbi:hypothetical protein CHARACLAT_010015 [Characodon lateralis]|uniref:Uncharacterized protein n=1 Tax=Characodon lateralis TaxID=208331 RepID=A0ABU7F414_9TELE|nr:hypothetical protein [Characodon lateralis]